MLIQSTTIAAVLAAPSVNPSPPFEVSSVETEDSAYPLYVAFDANHEVTGQVEIWPDNGAWTIAADFADGYALYTIDPQSPTPIKLEGDLPAELVASRMAAISHTLATARMADPSHPEKGLGACLFAAGGAAASIATANVVGAMVSSVAVACSCGPLFDPGHPTVCDGWW